MFKKGNPNSVTLIGQSAGSIAIGLLMSSPISSHLFRRVILESSSPMQLKLFYQISNKSYKRVVKMLDCDKNQTEQQIECLRKVSSEQLNEAQKVLMNDSFISFSPSIPSQVLPQFPREAFDLNEEENEIFQKEVLLG